MKTIFRVFLFTAIAVVFTLGACKSPVGGKTQVAKPELEEDHFVFKGSPHTVELSVKNAAYELGGDVTQTDFGSYTATVTLIDIGRYEWADGTTTPLNLNWSIGKQRIDKPELEEDHFVFNGSPHTVELTAENDAYELGGDITKTDNGNYIATVTLVDTANCEWDDGTSEPLDFNWSIGKQQIAKPALTQNLFAFIDSPITVSLTVTNVAYELSGDVTETAIGDYSAFVTLISTNNYEWADGSSTPLQLDWAIVDNPNIGMDGLTEETAFRVYNQATLEQIGSETGSGNWTRSAHYLLINDITLTGYRTPIGTYNSPFTGNFDGGGYSISGLAINAPSDRNQGLFGYISTAGVVKNLNLVNVNNIAEESVGSVAGLSYGTLQNISVTGRVEGNRNQWDVTVGGIVGQNLGLVENCSFSGEVVGASTSIGGIVGLLNGGTVRYCYVEGSVSGPNNVGGVAGRTTGPTAAVEYCVALNSTITRTGSGTGTGFGRVIGSQGNATQTGNYARSGLVINISPQEPAGIQGTDITNWNPAWFASIGFTDHWWTGRLPTGP